jgi:RND family efflux transporter MFP subunit
MNKHILTPLLSLLFPLLMACQPEKNTPPAAQPTDTVAAKPAQATARQQAQLHSTATKGRIEATREIPVFSRIAEQIVMLGIERTGQHVTKGQVVARLSDAALREKILHSRAKLEKAEFQYQAIVMGQGYKHDHLDEAPESLKRLARINSGYNEAKAEIHELEHMLSYCTVTAPISGEVTKIQNTLYGAALPGEALFYIVDTEHLKVSFGVLENELAKYEKGAKVSVTTMAYPTEQHSATVSAISPVIDDNGMVSIEATLEPHPHLKPGMTAFITIATD